MLQSISWQRRMLRLAQADNYDDLYWVVLAKWPLGEVEGKTSLERERKRYRYPTIGGSIPVVPVGPDAQESREMALFLADVLATRGEFSPLHKTGLMLVVSSELDRTPWHRWGNYDTICSNCGQIIDLQKCICNTDKGGLFATI